ncbi:LuxR family transcriptional regulator [Isoptericola sp. NPDC019482]|uniref:helix-turn-helix transcriptional regulator n=1 Tax=Isoptericola sp. NPDC019482 TaxID=3154688 RepID=UPI00349187A6
MLLGRDAEVATIDRLLAGARLGEAGRLVLLGEPGVGKSALLEHTAAALGAGGPGPAAPVTTVRVLRATGTVAESEIPFAGLSQLFAGCLDRISDLPGRQAAALAAALAAGDGARPAAAPVPGPAAGDRLAVGAATLGMLTRCAEDGPVAVLVDDLHDLDAPSAQALVFAARRLGADRVAMVLAARTPEADDLVVGLPVVRLAGLAEVPARALAERAAGGPVPAGRFAELYGRSVGNPLALIELATHPGALWPEIAGMPSTVPETITRAFSRRVGLLPAPAHEVLLVAAVADGDLALTSAAAATLGLDLADLDAAEDAGLVTSGGGRLAFRHPLLRSVVYTGAPAGRRRAAHRAVAAALPPGDDDRRAWHLAESVRGPDAAVADLLHKAGDRAAARAGHTVASAAYRRAAALSPSVERRGDRLLRAAGATWAAGDARAALRLLDELGELAVAPAVARGALELRAGVAARTGALRDAVTMLRRLAAETSSSDDRVHVLADAAYVAFFLGGTAVSLELAAELEALVPTTTTARARALALLGCGTARVLAGRGGIAEVGAAVPILEADAGLASDPRWWRWLMIVPLYLRDASGAGALADRVPEVRRAATVAELPGLLFLAARGHATGDTWERATAEYSLAVDIARETGQRGPLAAALAGRCWHAARQGDVVRCRADADEAMQLCRGGDMHLLEAWVRFAVGDLALSRGDVPTAVAELTDLEALLERYGMEDVDLAPVPELVEALVREGDLAGARRRVPSYAARARAKGSPWALARASRATALVADDDADAAFDAALALHARTPDVFEAARTRLAYGQRLRRSGRRVDARGHLRAALETFERLGAAAWSERAASELTATGEVVRRSGDGWRAALTPQELQVGILLADGHTTREAAAALFLSPKTVEYHLRKVYVKLGIHSREALAAALSDG